MEGFIHSLFYCFICVLMIYNKTRIEYLKGVFNLVDEYYEKNVAKRLRPC
jgi:hypothetical protein